MQSCEVRETYNHIDHSQLSVLSSSIFITSNPTQKGLQLSSALSIEIVSQTFSNTLWAWAELSQTTVIVQVIGYFRQSLHRHPDGRSSFTCLRLELRGLFQRKLGYQYGVY